MTIWSRKATEYDYGKSLEENRNRDHGAVICPCCQNEVDIELHDTACDKCGQLFNSYGQALRPESEWED
jgi:predicted amidophosphoribosyltransferase